MSGDQGEPRHREQTSSGALTRLDRTVTRLTVTVEQLVEQVKSLETKAVSSETVGDIRRRVEGLESARDWIVRLVLGAIILALLALVVKGNVSS